MKIIAITQARIGSSRLPAKVLKTIKGKSLLEIHLQRALKSKRIDKLFVATTIETDAIEICNICDKIGVSFFRGSVENVLDRYYQIAKAEQPDYVVRITSDCPLIDADVIDEVIKAAIDGEYDYTSNTLKATYPDGIDVEVLSFSALETAWKKSGLNSEKEHVTPYIRKNSDHFNGKEFKSFSFELKTDYSAYRLTVDEPADFELIKILIENIGTEKQWKDYVNYIDQNPELFKINSTIIRNEGYMKSIQKESIQLRNISNFAESDKYRNSIHDLIPGGAHTYSKGDDQFPQRSPAAISHGKGSHVWDIDGNEFLDCSMGLTSIGLGHAYEPVLEKVRKELENGVNFQRPSILEKEMAEKFLSLIPQHQMVKFAKNGSTVTTAAVKLARAYTGRKLVAFPGDHPFYSYDDWFIGKTDCSKGVPDEISGLSVTFKSGDLDSLNALFKKYPGQIACVITEPERSAPGDFQTGNGAKEYLQKAMAIAHQNGALFIIDEMITGLKTALPGSIVKFGLEPDMATWGKGIANGFSFCALTGKKEIMELGGIREKGAEKVFLISTTHGAETHALAAGIASLDEFINKNVIDHNQGIGNYFIEKCNAVISKNNMHDFIDLIPCNWMSVLIFKDRNKTISSGYRTLAMQEMIKRGVLFQGAFVPCFSHTKEDINYFSEALNETLKVYQSALNDGYEKYLAGEPAKPVFRKYL